MQSAIAVRQLAFVDQQPQVDVTVHNGVFDLIEWGWYGHEIRLVQTQREISARQRPRNRYSFSSNLGPVHWLARHEARSISVTHGRAVRKQGIRIGEICIGVNRDCRDLELSAQRALVERLDILELVNIAQLAGIDLPFRKRIEHERVVRIRAMSDVNGAGQCDSRFGWMGSEGQRERGWPSRPSISFTCWTYSGNCLARSVGAAAAKRRR